MERVQFDNLRDAEDYVRKLEEEIDRLRGQLRLAENLGSCFNTSIGDGPIACLLYFNTPLSRIHRRNLENKMQNVNDKGDLKRYSTDLSGLSTYSNQNSAADIDLPDGCGSLKVEGKVEYFHHFCIDSFGLPLQVVRDEVAPVYTPPKYTQIYTSEIWCVTPSQSTSILKSCWNCGGDHNLKECPDPPDHTRIKNNRHKFQKFSPKTSNRYHATSQSDKDARFKKFKPGHLSDNLRKALGLNENNIPEHIIRMRELGYPPGYKLAANNWSGMTLYNENLEFGDNRNVARDKGMEKVPEVLYPGFNIHPSQRYNQSGKKEDDMEMSSDIEDGEIMDLSDESVQSPIIDVDVAPPMRNVEPLAASEDCVVSTTQLKTSGPFSQDQGNITRTVESSERHDHPTVTLHKSRFSMDFPPSVLDVVVNSNEAPQRWTTIKHIIDQNKHS